MTYIHNIPTQSSGQPLTPLAHRSPLFRGSRLLLTFIISLILVLLLAACGDNNAVPVNGFGTAANHVHSMLALPPNVLVLATHYGLFRSQDSGLTWKEVAGGSNQPIDGLMTYALTVSPIDPQRLYVLTLPVAKDHAAVPGLYTSADQGRTWQMAIATASLTQTSIFTEAAGNDTPTEVYIYLNDLGALGLRVSLDAGQHFSSTGTLPFSPINGLLALPGAQGQLLVYGSGGIARSADGGIHWQVLSGITGGVYGMTTAGPHLPIYASGDAGIFVSQDGGVSFKLVNTQASYGSLTASPSQPQLLYGKTATAIFRSTDGGHTWSTLPHISGNYQTLAANPTDPSQVYLSLSYPTAVYRLGSSGQSWLSLTPSA